MSCSVDMRLRVDLLDKIRSNALRVMQQDKRLTPTARRVTKGSIPSVDQCLDGLQSIL